VVNCFKDLLDTEMTINRSEIPKKETIISMVYFTFFFASLYCDTKQHNKRKQYKQFHH